MSSKQKFILAVVAVMLFGLVAAICIVGVFAARKQGFESKISVRYTATQIEGSVSAKYYVGGSDKTGKDMTTTGNASGQKVINFYASDENLTQSLIPQEEIVLSFQSQSSTTDKKYVVFEYCFKDGGLGNIVTTDYIAELSFDGEFNNVRITTSQSDTKLTDFKALTGQFTKQDLSCLDNVAIFVMHNEENPNSFTTKYVYIKVEIEDPLINANFGGNFSWNMYRLDKNGTGLENLTFENVGDHNVVSSSSKSFDNSPKAIVIPAYYNGLPVTEIGDGITTLALYIPSTITTINTPSPLIGFSIYVEKENETYTSRDSKGSECNILMENSSKKIINMCVSSIFPDNAKSIDLNYDMEEWFSEGWFLNNIKIPASLTEGLDRFVNWYDIEQIVVDDGNPRYKSKDADGKECYVIVEQTTGILLKGCRYSTIPNDGSVRKINNYAFAACKILSGQMVIPESVDEVDYNAFFACTGLRSLKILGSSLVDLAFCMCGELNSVTIGLGVETIGDGVFTFCSNLNEVIIDSPTIYAAIMGVSTENGGLTAQLKSGTGTIKVLKSIVDNPDYTNTYLNDDSETAAFTKNPTTITIDGEEYYVYIKK